MDVLTDKQIEEHTYKLVAVEEGEIGTEYNIYHCTKPGCTHRKIEEAKSKTKIDVAYVSSEHVAYHKWTRCGKDIPAVIGIQFIEI